MRERKNPKQLYTDKSSDNIGFGDKKSFNYLKYKQE